MKKLFTILFVVMISTSCMKQKEVYVEAKSINEFGMFEEILGNQRASSGNIYSFQNLKEMNMTVSVYDSDMERQVIYEGKISNEDSKKAVELFVITFDNNVYLELQQNEDTLVSFDLKEYEETLLVNHHFQMVTHHVSFRLPEGKPYAIASALFDTTEIESPSYTFNNFELRLPDQQNPLVDHQILVLVEVQNNRE